MRLFAANAFPRPFCAHRNLRIILPLCKTGLICRQNPALPGCYRDEGGWLCHPPRQYHHCKMSKNLPSRLPRALPKIILAAGQPLAVSKQLQTHPP